MFESVWDFCKELVFGNEALTLSLLEQNRLCHDTFMAFRTSLYFGGETYLEQLSPDNLKEHPTVLVKGMSGCGKSALLANLVKRLKENETGIMLIYHFVGSALGTTDSKSILQHVLAELKHINGTESQLQNNINLADGVGHKTASNDFHEIFLNVQTELVHASTDGRNIVIIIDGLEKVKASSKTEKHLYWLPEHLPKGISIIASTEDSDQSTIDILVNQRHFYEVEIHPLDTATQENISKETLMIKGKELSPHQLERIIKAEQTKNPLFLKIVLSEISIYGYFRLLDKKIDSLIYSNGVKDLLTKVLERLEEDYNLDKPLVEQVLSAIAVSHCGLSEPEILDIFNINTSSWSPFYFSMENFFIIHEGLLRFAFSELEIAVKERYLNTEEKRHVAIKNLIDYFERQRKTVKVTPELLNSMLIKRISDELPYLQHAFDDKIGLINTLSDVRIFYALEKKNVYELIDLWTASNNKQDTIVQSLFASFDLTVAHFYNQEQDNTCFEPPGYVLLPVLLSMKRMFSTANYYRASVKTYHRIINILEGIKGKISEEIRISRLRESRYFLACTYVDNTEYDKAQLLHESVMEECRILIQQNDDNFILQTLAYTCNGLGILHLRQKHYIEAEPLLQESYELHLQIGNDLCCAEAIQNLGIVKLETGQPEVALKYFQQAMEVFERVYFGFLPIEVGNLLTNMALCYRRMKDNDKAEAMYQRSLTVKAKAVGWNHEVIATCYTNLGTLEFYRNNYCKAEEYTRKAIQILELNEVKMEQNEMWQAKENLVLNLITQGRWEEALPIFQNVFKILKQENQIDQALVSVHKEMIKYMTHMKMFEEAAEVAICHITSHKNRHPSIYVLLDYCDNQAVLFAGKPKPKRPKLQTVRYALDEMWPGNNELTAYIAQTYLVPENDVNALLQLVSKMDEMNPNFESTSYTIVEQWCTENTEMLLSVFKRGLEKYPHSDELKVKLFNQYRLLQQFTEAYALVKDVVAIEPTNQSLLLVAGDVAFRSGDFDLSIQLWEKVSIMPDENLAQMAKTALETIKDFLEQSKENKTIH